MTEANPQPETTKPVVDEDVDFSFNEEPVTQEVLSPSVEKKPQKVRSDNTAFEITPSKPIHPGDVVFSLPDNLLSNIEANIADSPNATSAANNTNQSWYTALTEGLRICEYTSEYEDALRNENSDWSNEVPVKSTKEPNKIKRLKGRHVSPPNVSDTSSNTGEKYVLRLSSGLGMSGNYVQPLWNSGFWIIFKPPTEAVFLEMHALLTRTKVRIGREHSGMLLSGSDVENIKILTDLAFEHIYTTSLSLNSENIRDFVLDSDIDNVLHGFACSIHPKGFPYSRACTNDIEKCQHEHISRLRLDALQYVNRAALSEKQLEFMSSHMASRSMTIAEVLEYQKELKDRMSKTVAVNTPVLSDDGSIVNEVIKIKLTKPSLTDYINSSLRWIDKAKTMALRTLAKDATEEQRSPVIQDFANSIALGQYSHYVESITDKHGIVQRDRISIEAALANLTQDDDLYTEIVTHVREFIFNSTVTVIGIPIYECPKCTKLQEPENPREAFKEIIPLDMVQLFFALRGWYAALAVRRKTTLVPLRSTSLIPSSATT